MFAAKSLIWAPMMILSKKSENIFCSWKFSYFNDQRLKVFCGNSWFFSKFRYQKIRDSGPEPGLKIENSGIGDWDRDSDLRDEGFRDSILGDCHGD